MPMEKLTLENLHLIDDGALKVAFNRELEKIYHDCMDRPHLKAKRTITLSLDVTPDASDSQGSQLSEAIVAFAVQTKIPKKSTAKRVRCAPKKAGFDFNADTNNVSFDEDQTTLPFDEE